jgi:hypothetical protein
MASPSVAQPTAQTFFAAADEGRTAIANTARSSFLSPNTDLQNSLPTSQPAATAFQRDYATVNLRYTESSPIRVCGPVTGRDYEFSGANPVQSVDARDADLLLRARFFRPL